MHVRTMSPHFTGRGRYNSTQFPEVLPEEQQGEYEAHYWAHEHANVLAFNELSGMQVNIDHIWPAIPDNVEVVSVWEPWGQPNGQYVNWVNDPNFVMPWPVDAWPEDEPSQNSDESQQTQQAGFD